MRDLFIMMCFMVMGSCNKFEKSDGAFQKQLAELYLKRDFSKLKDFVSNLDHPVSAELKHLAYRLVDYIDRFWKEYPSDVRLVKSSDPDFIISKEECFHQSVFLSQKTDEHGAVEFFASSEITSKAQYFEPQRLLQSDFVALPDTVLPFVAERAPHILFSDSIRHLADSLTNDGMKPFEMVRQFYYWMDAHIPWARAVEYGLMDSIPQYTLEKMHGDCGMQTLLFMTLCRYKGIPARWQSGWMLHRGNVNLHDWCEVWYAGVGWVPVDVSFKLQNSNDPRVREFYVSGIDAYRFTVNNDFGQVFCPSKTWLRSEPLDFQRGEVEWEHGNLYFDAWTYKMGVTYLN